MKVVAILPQVTFIHTSHIILRISQGYDKRMISNSPLPDTHITQTHADTTEILRVCELTKVLSKGTSAGLTKFPHPIVSGFPPGHAMSLMQSYVGNSLLLRNDRRAGQDRASSHGFIASTQLKPAVPNPNPPPLLHHHHHNDMANADPRLLFFVTDFSIILLQRYTALVQRRKPVFRRAILYFFYMV